MIITIEVKKCICDECKHGWVPKAGSIPVKCPRCQSTKWNGKGIDVYDTPTSVTSSSLKTGVDISGHYKKTVQSVPSVTSNDGTINRGDLEVVYDDGA